MVLAACDLLLLTINPEFSIISYSYQTQYLTLTLSRTLTQAHLLNHSLHVRTLLNISHTHQLYPQCILATSLSLCVLCSSILSLPITLSLNAVTIFIVIYMFYFNLLHFTVFSLSIINNLNLKSESAINKDNDKV